MVMGTDDTERCADRHVALMPDGDDAERGQR